MQQALINTVTFLSNGKNSAYSNLLQPANFTSESLFSFFDSQKYTFDSFRVALYQAPPFPFTQPVFVEMAKKSSVCFQQCTKLCF